MSTSHNTNTERSALIYDTFIREFAIYSANNRSFTATHDRFLRDIPIRSIFKDVLDCNKQDVDVLLDRVNADEITRFFVSIEFDDVQSLKKVITVFRTVSEFLERADAGDGYERPPEGKFPKFIVDFVFGETYYTEYLYQNICEQASLRLRPDVVKLLTSDRKVNFRCDITERYFYYGITKELRDLFIAYNKSFIDDLHHEADFENDAYALVKNSDWDRMELFLTTTSYAIRCRDKELYTAYYQQVFGEVPHEIHALFDNVTDKYVVDRYGIDALDELAY